MLKYILPMLLMIILIAGCSQRPTDIDTMKEVVKLVRESDTAGEFDFETQDGSVYAKQEFGLQPPVKIRGQIRVERRANAEEEKIPISVMMDVLKIVVGSQEKEEVPVTQPTTQPAKE